MNSITNYISELIIVLVTMVFLLSTPLLMGGLLMDSVANAAYVQQNYPVALNSTYSSGIIECMTTQEAIRYLRNGLWVKDYVSDETLEEYILLCKQAASDKTYVTPELLLGVIAIESRFDADALSVNGARGLCQMIFGYHADRMEEITGEEASPTDFSVPWKNIFCAADYLEEIREQVRTYESVRDHHRDAFSLMWYNMGPATASTVYLAQGRVSSYAKNVLAISEKLETIFAKGEIWRAET